MGGGDAQALLSELIAFDSTCPDRSGAQRHVASRLLALGFAVETFDVGGANHLWASLGQVKPLLVFSGHTDVVPPGPIGEWDSPPFHASVREGRMYGRGACDMKGGLAAMIAAVERYASKSRELPFSIGFLIVGDEEGASAGTPALLSILTERGVRIDDCIVGEPTSTEVVGDVIKIGRRGSLSGELVFRGVQGHVGYPHLAKNAIHCALKSLERLVAHEWDRGNRYFDPTTFQITGAQGGVAENIVPGEFRVSFNWRYSSELNEEKIRGAVVKITDEALKEYPGVGYDLDLRSSAEPFLTEPGELSQALVQAIESVLKRKPVYSTSGGTSDARFFPKYGARVLEFGLVNATIHKANESTDLLDLDNLTSVFEDFLARYGQALK